MSVSHVELLHLSSLVVSFPAAGWRFILLTASHTLDSPTPHCKCPAASDHCISKSPTQMLACGISHGLRLSLKITSSQTESSFSLSYCCFFNFHSPIFLRAYRQFSTGKEWPHWHFPPNLPPGSGLTVTGRRAHLQRRQSEPGVTQHPSRSSLHLDNMSSAHSNTLG